MGLDDLYSATPDITIKISVLMLWKWLPLMTFGLDVRNEICPNVSLLKHSTNLPLESLLLTSFLIYRLFGR